MKKLINNPDRVVTEMLQGLCEAEPELVYAGEGIEVVSRREKTPGKVGLVSGGGSGHEPAHAGYVGKGMLDAAVAGNVFASPSPDRILEGIHAADGGAGVLLIIKNYSGDIMNFQMAAELAQMEGIRTECVVVKDDVAVPDSTYSAGRRGIAGTVLVHKIAGAAAESGKNLDEVKRIAEKVIVNLRSMGMAMSPCILPAVGICREDLTPAAETAKTLLSRILEDFDYSKSETAMLVNGLGGTPLMELYIMSRELTRILREKGITAVRTIVGNYMTSLEMAGCSVTLLKLDEELKALLAAPADTPAFKC